MSDEYPHDKPYRLLASFESLYRPGVPKSPLDIHVKFDPYYQIGATVVTPRGINNWAIGDLNLKNYLTIVNPEGVAPLPISNTNNVFNNARVINAQSIHELSFGYPRTYNLKQDIKVSNGIHQTKYGVPFLIGGVRYLYAWGVSSPEFVKTHSVFNPQADQSIILSGIGAPAVSANLHISPRFIFARSIDHAAYGQPTVRRNPSPNGFVNTSYGQPIVWFRVRGITATSYTPRDLLGFPKLFDPIQKIGVVTTVISGGVFGDIRVRNKNHFIKAIGDDSAIFSNWSVFESNRRAVLGKGLSAFDSGVLNIWNKTPSISPIGIANIPITTNLSIGYWKRTIKPTGSNNLSIGYPGLKKTPELFPSSKTDQALYGQAIITHRHRYAYTAGSNFTQYGQVEIWHYKRLLNTAGSNFNESGSPRIEHGLRSLVFNGAGYSAYGHPWVSFRVRPVFAPSIHRENATNHLIGNHRSLYPIGFSATQFGERIIPIATNIYPQGSVLSLFGLTSADLKKKIIKPGGFLTAGVMPEYRWGYNKVWNTRQYITQNFDVNSDLVPPIWPIWTKIENRNKIIKAISSEFSKLGSPHAFNYARVILPEPILGVVSNPTIWDRIRRLRLEGLEPPYLSSWVALWNKAAVIKPVGINSQQFGSDASFLNTRRTYNRIGNFETLVFGQPMISFNLRNITFESRYSIEQPRMELPTVKLHTRYVDAQGSVHSGVGMPDLVVKFNIITPRWTLINYFGWCDVRNKTPVVTTRGKSSDEHGVPYIGLYTRYVTFDSIIATAFGRTTIADTKRTLTVNGFKLSTVSDYTKVTKTGAPPYSRQHIYLNGMRDFEDIESEGNGIAIPYDQVSRNTWVHQNILWVFGFNAFKTGNNTIHSNGIIQRAGIKIDGYGIPAVRLKNRKIEVEQGIGSQVAVGMPRLSPHTIWAVKEAPYQAQLNHPASGPLHYVDSDYGWRNPPGSVVGIPRIRGMFEYIQQHSYSVDSVVGIPSVQLKRRYIQVTGIQAYRFGWHKTGDGTEEIIVFASNSFMYVGSPSVKGTINLNRSIRVNGILSLQMGGTWASHYHRKVDAKGFDFMAMGTMKSGDTPYMWQGLRIGPLMPTRPVGMDHSKYGNHWIGFRVRELKPISFDSFLSEYDYTMFNERMRVTQAQLPRPILWVQPIGFDAQGNSVSDIRLKAHYIRPDGNADQYRKGAF